ncbi:methylmalonyl-CoA mutase [Methyloceanibacter stevinii]|uniref:Methylmalonyl-CoA mutase n=1 Tax=Methyloceanibacter stevinii TaxID=1774970 RepID=A0A1E3VUH2_9HYPH|nr:methylmalonyl-CoA mutase family protein [Methyloceanibacter stevinii]ODR96931.1 methylmalonyl-CoA mutase [Methyloceanibacter stevinii]
MSDLSLVSAFPKAEDSAWKELVEKALKGAPFSVLESKTYDGAVIEPLYAPATNGAVIPSRDPGTPWEITQRIDIADAGVANGQILEDLNNGASGIALVFQGAVGECGYALPADADALGAALEGVHLEWGVPLELQLGANAAAVANIVADLVDARGLPANHTNIRFGFDPIGVLAAHGATDASPEDVAALAKDLSARGFKGPFAAADGRLVHDAGGTEAQELAFALASAIAYLRAFEAAGIPLDEARRMIFFRLSTDQNQFLTTAKFRALRKLWSRIEEACGLTPEPAFVTGETAWRMMTKRHAQGNIVRGTIAALAAAVGGANAVTVQPYTAALGLPEASRAALARNTQTVLLEESNLYRVADPAAGSGALEALTSDLCAKAWRLFQKFEEAGGVIEVLGTGLFQEAVAETRRPRDSMARRKESLIGTSDFPDLGEDDLTVMDVAPAPFETGAQEVMPLKPMRLGAPFEALRDRSDAVLAKTGARPKIYLACLGRPADFNTRASFAKSLFEAGGIEAIAATSEQTLAETVEGFRASGASLACLCSSDKVYAADGAEAAKALRDAGAAHVYLAGKPGDLEAALREAGVESFVFQGCDVLAVLDGAQATLGG